MIKNIAHRGFSGLYPENTILAFEKAIAEGVYGIENDVHYTKDGELVVIHDEKVDRTTDGVGYVRDYTLKELRKLERTSDEPGFTIVPVRMYINEKGLAKVVIALAKGKKQYDKRQTLKEKEDKRMMDRMFKR